MALILGLGWKNVFPSRLSPFPLSSLTSRPTPPLSSPLRHIQSISCAGYSGVFWFIRVLMGALKIPLINHHQSINIIIPPPLSLLNLGFQGRLGQIVCTRVIIAKETRKYFWNTTRKIRKTRCGLERRIYGIHVMLLCSSRPLLPPPNLCFGGFFRWGEEVRGIILFYQPTGPSSP